MVVVELERGRLEEIEGILVEGATAGGLLKARANMASLASEMTAGLIIPRGGIGHIGVTRPGTF